MYTHTYRHNTLKKFHALKLAIIWFAFRNTSLRHNLPLGINKSGVGEMAQKLRVLAAFEDWSLVPRVHIRGSQMPVTLGRVSVILSGLWGHLKTCVYTYDWYIHINKRKHKKSANPLALKSTKSSPKKASKVLRGTIFSLWTFCPLRMSRKEIQKLRCVL